MVQSLGHLFVPHVLSVSVSDWSAVQSVAKSVVPWEQVRERSRVPGPPQLTEHSDQAFQQAQAFNVKVPAKNQEGRMLYSSIRINDF